MQSPKLDLPYIDPLQAQKHITHNEALQRLDACVQLSVRSRSLSTPPAAPQEGNCFLVAGGASGAWTGADGQVASLQNGAWLILTPRIGWLAYVEEEESFVVFRGPDWAPISNEAANALTRLGINATPDDNNRFVLRAAASLFDNEGGSHRLALNKASVADTGSLLFQTNYSGRAEIGLCGTDGFALKTSPDGTTWSQAMLTDPATGRVTFPAGLGGISIPIMGNSHASVAAGQTRYISPGLIDTNPALVYCPVPVAGTFTKLRCVTAQGPGIGESWTFTLHNVYTATALTCTISGTSTNEGLDDVHEARFSAGGRYSIKVEASSGAADSGAVLFSLLFTPD